MSISGLKFLLISVPILLGVAFFTLLERKVLSIVGFRVGPNKVSLAGFLQPLGDAAKLANKQINTLGNFSFFFYYLSSGLLIFGALFLWCCFFSDPNVLSFKYLLLFVMLVLSVNSLSSIFVGWSSFSKYSLIGSIRTVSQLISYEASLYICLFFVFSLFFCYNFHDVSFFSAPLMGFLLPYGLYIWVPSFLAELNRTPYDFSEGESELVSGFNTEFGSKSFTLIFLAEYANMIFFCSISGLLFFMPFPVLFFFFFFFFFDLNPKRASSLSFR